MTLQTPPKDPAFPIDGNPAAGAGLPQSDTPVWVLHAYRAGENSQLKGLAERLEHPYVSITPRHDWHSLRCGLLRVAGDRSTLARWLPMAERGPWPALVIGAGMKNEPIVRAIQQASGGVTRTVMLGRTWAPVDCFDLLVTTPQYRVPAAPNVIENPLTLHNLTREVLDNARLAAPSALRELPKPVTAVLLGGNSGPFVLGPRVARDLAGSLETFVAESGGSLAITTSARTPLPFLTLLEKALPQRVPRFVYRFRPDDPENPYRSVLAIAEHIVVTGDSVAMLSEATATGARVLIFDVATGDAGDQTAGARIYRALMALGPQRLSRDVGLFHQAFLDAGYGEWLSPGDRSVAASAGLTSEASAATPRASKNAAAADEREKHATINPASAYAETLIRIRAMIHGTGNVTPKTPGGPRHR